MICNSSALDYWVLELFIPVCYHIWPKLMFLIEFGDAEVFCFPQNSAVVVQITIEENFLEITDVGENIIV